MELSEQFTQQPFPGMDPDKIARESRENAIRQNFVSGDTFLNTFSSRLGRAVARDMRSTKTSKIEPNKDVVNILKLSDMPVEDLRKSGTVVVSDSGSGFFTNLSGSTLGNHNVSSGYVTYKSKLPIEKRRGVMVHELAHVLQHDMTQSQLDTELHKVHRGIWEKMANTPDKPEPTDMSDGSGVVFETPDNSRTREKGEKELNRYAHFDTGAYRHLEAPSLHLTGTPIYEGSAEGYRLKFQGKAGLVTSYSPEFFTKQLGGHAGEAYQTAFDYSHQTGKPVTDSIVMQAARLAGVLKSDLDEKGDRRSDHDASTVHRMTTHLLQKEMGHTELPHEKEFQERMKAVEGEHIQQSMFPDLAPDIDQFGNPAGAPVQRSSRGEALLAGMRTELPVELTIERQARKQHQIARERYVKTRGMGFVKDTYGGRPQFKYKDTKNDDLRHRLKVHVEEKKKRDETNAMSQSGELHPEISKWIDKLVYDKKIEYAKAYGMARQSGGALPELPKGLKEEHAEATRTKIDQIIAKHRIA